MLKPLKIRNTIFSTNLIQAPLAGLSCAPFRELVWEFGGAAYCCTEMLSASHVASGVDRSPRYNVRSPTEKTLCWQLSGNNPTVLAKASERAIASGADLIDLNCGCPQPKIRKKGCGSKLLSDEKKLSALVEALRQDEKTPVTVKIRVDAGQGEFCEVSLAKMLEAAGADAIIVHGRHWSHDYDVSAQYDAIANIVSSVSIPVIGNGDVADSATVSRLFSETQCAGFMIARASVGQPWLFQKIRCELAGNDFAIPTQSQIGALFLKHVRGLIALEGEMNALFQSRRFGKYYARTLQNKDDFLEQLYGINAYSPLAEVVNMYFS